MVPSVLRNCQASTENRAVDSNHAAPDATPEACGEASSTSVAAGMEIKRDGSGDSSIAAGHEDDEECSREQLAYEASIIFHLGASLHFIQGCASNMIVNT